MAAIFNSLKKTLDQKQNIWWNIDKTDAERVLVVIIDGQGGGVGRALTEAVRKAYPTLCIRAVGTNALATAAMLKAGASEGATGENAVIFNVRQADVLLGPIGILVADALMGEITPAMAVAVGQSSAAKLLFPVAGSCSTIVVGTQSLTLSKMMDDALEQLRTLL